MALVKSALFDRIKGSVDDVTFRERRNKKIELSQKGIPFDPESPAQLRSDAGYTRLAKLLRTATWPNWDKYDSLAAIDHISRWNAWVKRHMPVMSQGPLAYWGFAEDEGVILHDFTANENNGDIFGATWIPDGLYFDGINDRVNCGDIDETEGIDKFTVGAWSRRESPNGYVGIVAKYGGPRSWLLYMSGADASPGRRNQPQFLVAADSTVHTDDGSNTGEIKLNEWTYITGVYNSTHITIYQDGTPRRTKPLTGDIATNTQPVEIGRFASNYFNGTIDDVELWNRALSEKEIKKIYEATKRWHL